MKTRLYYNPLPTNINNILYYIVLVLNILKNKKKQKTLKQTIPAQMPSTVFRPAGCTY